LVNGQAARAHTPPHTPPPIDTNPRPAHTRRTHRLAVLAAVLVLSSCASTQSTAPASGELAAARWLRQARVKSTSTEERIALYLRCAAEAKALMGSPSSAPSARETYNKAVADLTVLLREADGGRHWNRPVRLEGAQGITLLRFAKGGGEGGVDPEYFQKFVPASEVAQKSIARKNSRAGVGGALVGIRRTEPLADFSPQVGVTAPVTAVVDFKGNEAILTLLDPTAKPTLRFAGAQRPVEADFSAPLAYYPQRSELWNGLMGALRVSQNMGTTGLYMLQPYDPERIPLIFVHGLISTPRMWRNVINELEFDPVLRDRYQCWVFSYPTGNPPAYSAMRLREELAKVDQTYPGSKPAVLVGHSMGGILSRMQVTNVSRRSWDVIGTDKAAAFFENVQPGSLVERATIFRANPNIDRVIFICTPHRGSKMAIGGLGDLAMRLISMPADLTGSVSNTVGSSIALITGDANRMPNSVTGLSPDNPTLKVLDSVALQVPHHTIAGDEGKGDAPNSSDGVVEYWSSHLRSAKSELMVPGPHGACEMPETLAEMRRILHLHLQQSN